MSKHTQEQLERFDKAQQELENVLERYAVTLGVDLVTYDHPVVFLVCNEELDRPRLH